MVQFCNQNVVLRLEVELKQKVNRVLSCHASISLVHRDRGGLLTPANGVESMCGAEKRFLFSLPFSAVGNRRKL